jgi:hypothetical protein
LVLEQPSVTFDGTVHVAQRQQDAGMGDPHPLIAGFGGHQPHALLARPLMLLQVDEGEHEVVAGGVVVGGLGQQLFQQLLGVDVVLEMACDPGEHPQALDVVGVVGEVGVHGALGVLEVAVSDHGACGDDRLRQLAERRHMVRRVGLLTLAAGDPVELLQGLPTRGQGRVDAYRGLEGLDRLGRVARQHVTVPALLEEARVARVEGLQRGERGERLGDAVEHALRRGDEVEQVPVAAVLAEVGIGDLQHFHIAATAERRAQHGQRCLDGGKPGGGVLRLQCGPCGRKAVVKKKRRAVSGPPPGVAVDQSPKR